MIPYEVIGGEALPSEAEPRPCVLFLLEAYVAERDLLGVRLHADVTRRVVGRGRESAVLVLAGGLREGRDLLVGGLLAVLRLAEPHGVLVARDLDLELVPLARQEDGAGLIVLLLRLAALTRRNVVDRAGAVLL